MKIHFLPLTPSLCRVEHEDHSMFNLLLILELVGGFGFTLHAYPIPFDDLCGKNGKYLVMVEAYI
jgi:hypothetical protein